MRQILEFHNHLPITVPAGRKQNDLVVTLKNNGTPGDGSRTRTQTISLVQYHAAVSQASSQRLEQGFTAYQPHRHLAHV